MRRRSKLVGGAREKFIMSKHAVQRLVNQWAALELMMKILSLPLQIIATLIPVLNFLSGGIQTDPDPSLVDSLWGVKTVWRAPSVNRPRVTRRQYLHFQLPFRPVVCCGLFSAIDQEWGRLSTRAPVRETKHTNSCDYWV